MFPTRDQIDPSSALRQTEGHCVQYLIGDYETRADVALNTGHLANAGLWTGEADDVGFLPWYWPALLEMPDKRRAQIDFIKGELNSPVLRVFGFKDEAIEFLSRHAKGALSPNARTEEGANAGEPSIQEITFRDVFRDGNRSIPDKAERELLLKRQAAGNDRALDSIARVVAADIDRWFRLDVLGPQEALVDAPHLVARMPFLLGQNADDIAHWDSLATSQVGPIAMQKDLYDRLVKRARFSHDLFVRRPCFWWPELRASEDLNKLFVSSDATWADLAFCEDISRFKKREEAREFVAQIEGPWDRRHVAYNSKFKYAPRSRFAL
ncbi:hypothetical protein JQ616_06550 [Bradyrhizobium tropiciagri]|uniref:hypothetical protein n=1 Tax=Bradyrhizobium tropiciagri TaxID=312253 RepID=UPI001BADD3BF|nr:hypothetical protein [Bradyrhizobium tropiciagri]MBR0894601.1 hypothetical protein [Bradyrhizobium tropiciagri]